MRATQHNRNPRMNSLQPPALVHCFWKFTGHAADADNADVIASNVAIDVFGSPAGNLIQNVRPVAIFAEVCREVHVIQRDVIDVPVPRR